MKVFLTGGTGFIGSSIRNKLLEAGYEVTICSRHLDRSLDCITNLQQIQMDFNTSVHPQNWIQVIKGHDVVINATGIISESKKNSFDTIHNKAPIALFEACKKAKIKRVIQISALGANEKCTTAYHKSKKKADDYLTALPLECTIFYPSLVYGENDSSMNFFSALAALPIAGIIGDGSQKMQPILIDDLVRAVVMAATKNKTINQKVDAVGAEEITFIDLLKLLRGRLGLGKQLSFPIPIALAMAFSQISKWIPGALLTPDTLTMLQQGSTASVKGFEKNFAFIPNGIKQNMILKNANAKERWYSGIFFLRALLRASIVIVWFFSGVVSLWISSDRSYEILSMAGLTGIYAKMALYSGAILDIAFAFIVIFKWKPRLFSYIQISTIIVYTSIISFMIPELWLDPLGSILKNLPLLIAILILGALDHKK